MTGPDQAYPDPLSFATLVDLFERSATNAPDRLAVSAHDGELSYGDLWTRSCALAETLHESGVGPGTFVGLIADRSLDSVVGLLGILRIGAAYVPIDPSYPSDRIAFILEDSDIDIVVGAAAGAEYGVATVVAPSSRQRQAGPGPANDGAVAAGAPATPPQRHSIAYVIYTSGSTGQPKGCPITHENVLMMLQSALPYVSPGSGDVWSVFHSLSFDFSVWELWGAWATGAHAAIVPATTALDPRAWLAFCVSKNVTIISQVPSVFRFLVQALHKSEARLHARYVVLGGESIDLAIVRRWRERQSGPEAGAVVNMYGITEITVHATAKVIDDAVLDNAEVVASPIGVPLDHLHVELRGEDGIPVADGQPGEMWISGPSVAGGYLERPDLTAQRFVVATATDGTERSFYLSGDLARQVAGGLEYLGRIDDQVKVRGYRIELTEIERWLNEVPGVAGSAAVARPTSTGTHVLVAVVVCESGQQVSPEAIRASLRDRLPSFMVPDSIRLIPELPLSPSGKLDRRAVLRQLA